MKPEDLSAIDLLTHFLGEAAILNRAGDVGGALESYESAAFWLERKGWHLPLAEELLLRVLAQAPNRRRQLLYVRVLMRLGRDGVAQQIESRLLPRDEQDEREFRRLRAEFLEWLGAGGRASLLDDQEPK